MLHCRGVLRQGVAPAGTVSYDLSLAPACGRRLGWPPFIRSVLRLSRAALAARRALQGTRGEVVPAQCCTSKLISDGDERPFMVDVVHSGAPRAGLGCPQG